jgi:hypothetical protein
MGKKASERESSGGPVQLDRRGFVGKLGIAAAGVTAASFLPFQSSLAAVSANWTTSGVLTARSLNGVDVAASLPGYIHPIPYVYPRMTAEVVTDPMDHIFLA